MIAILGQNIQYERSGTSAKLGNVDQPLRETYIAEKELLMLNKLEKNVTHARTLYVGFYNWRIILAIW